MSDIVTWLNAQLDEDERLARAAGADTELSWHRDERYVAADRTHVEVPVTQGPTAPATSQAPPTKPTTQPVADLKTAVTGPRATGADPPRDFGDKINPPTRAIGIAKLPNQPKNCHHGQPLTKRPDGTPRCTPCHRTATLNTPTNTHPIITKHGQNK